MEHLHKPKLNTLVYKNQGCPPSYVIAKTNTAYQPSTLDDIAEVLNRIERALTVCKSTTGGSKRGLGRAGTVLGRQDRPNTPGAFIPWNSYLPARRNPAQHAVVLVLLAQGLASRRIDTQFEVHGGILQQG